MAETKWFREQRTVEGITERILTGSFVIHETNSNVFPPSVVRAQKALSCTAASTLGSFADRKIRQS
jgi:hypothetical protein